VKCGIKGILESNAIVPVPFVAVVHGTIPAVYLLCYEKIFLKKLIRDLVYLVLLRLCALLRLL
jgi:hypothetical protein